MDADDIKQLFVGLDAKTKNFIARDRKDILSKTIVEINNSTRKEELVPPPGLIFNAFRLCPLDQIRIVLLGQDPYINVGEAMGLSFSVPRGVKIPPSLRNIFKCLKHQHLISEIPDHGDLTSWAKQGILLLNAALTTRLGRSNAHADIWRAYTDSIIRDLSETATNSLIFILLGKAAQERAKLIDKNRHHVLEWGHPSPLNSDNKDIKNPKHFIHCNVFNLTNTILVAAGQTPIDWNSVCCENSAMVQPRQLKLWLFTDGGASRNGRAGCEAAWAYHLVVGNDALPFDQLLSRDGMPDAAMCESGKVPLTTISGKKYQTSNNRAELLAILNGLKRAAAMIEPPAPLPSRAESQSQIIVVSDSEYAIKSITEWAPKWFAELSADKLNKKMNLDLIRPIVELVANMKQRAQVVFRHINSHQNEPTNTQSEEWFLWKGNSVADYLCNKVLKS